MKAQCKFLYILVVYLTCSFMESVSAVTQSHFGDRVSGACCKASSVELVDDVHMTVDQD